MGNRLNVHQMKCIRKIPVGEGGTDKHTNIAFISEKNMASCYDRGYFRNYQNNEENSIWTTSKDGDSNRLRENYGLLPIKKR